MKAGDWIAIIAFLSIVGGIYTVGGKVNDAKWERRELALQQDAATKIAAANLRIINNEREHAKQIATIAADYEAQKDIQSRRTDAVIADLRNRNLRLSIGATCASSGNAAATTAASTGSSDGATRAELSDTAAEFLIGEANRADAVVAQLTACQAVVASDRTAH